MLQHRCDWADKDLEMTGQTKLLLTAFATITTTGCFSPNVSEELETETGDITGSGSTSDPATAGADESISSDGVTSGQIDGTAEEAGETASDCTEPDGHTSSACPSDTPFCVNQTCVDCTEAPIGACEALDPESPACDQTSGACTPCTAHEQCESGACQIASGRCVSTENTVYVDREADNCTGADGTPELPFCTITEALEIVLSQPTDTGWNISIHGSATAYDEAIQIEGGSPPIVFSADNSPFAARIESPAGSQDSALLVSSLSSSGSPPEVYVSGVTIEGATDCSGDDTRLYLADAQTQRISAQNRCEAVVTASTATELSSTAGASIVARAVHIEGSFGAIFIDRGSVQVHDSVLQEITTNGIYGIEIIDGDLVLENTAIFADYQIMFLDGTSNVEMNYSTVRGFLSPETFGQPFVCTMNDTTATVRVSNSLVYGFQYTFCSFSVEDSVVSLDESLSEEDFESFVELDNVNVVTRESYSEMFVADGDHHVLEGSLAEGAARWTEGDPVRDLDGDLRPTGPGDSDYAGADVP